MVALLDPNPLLCSRVEQYLEAWLSEFDAVDVTRRQAEISLAWTYTCSPAYAEPYALAVATLDITLWIFYLDDYEGDDYSLLFDACLKLLRRESLSVEEIAAFPILRLFAHHLRLVESFGRCTARFRERRIEIVSAYLARNQIGDRKDLISLAEYEEIRKVTIAIRCWLSGWEIACDFLLDDKDYISEPIHTAIEALTRWHYLQNDLRSVRRDLEFGIPNLVVLHQQETGLTLEDAVLGILGMCEREEQRLLAALAHARQQFDSNAGVALTLDFMEVNLRGGKKIYAQQHARYE
jgi:hypothetical protein